MLVVEPGGFSHRSFRDLPGCLAAGDVLVLNETRVIAARLRATRVPSGGAVELLLLRPSGGSRYDPGARRWQALARPGRRMREGQRISFGSLGEATVVAVLDDGIREVEFDLAMAFDAFLERAGSVPLPPYIHNDSPAARERYQTIFAREPGSVAAPTASLHFTQRVLDAAAERGVRIARLVLDVGLGTFRPMTAPRLEQHVMHAESYAIPQATVDAILQAKREGGRVVAAGTTVLRALEGAAAQGPLTAGEGRTGIFITPGFPFRVVDALVTNFHLPRSTLLVLVCAFAGRERILRAYGEAIAQGYRFFSFGDAMFLTRGTGDPCA